MLHVALIAGMLYYLHACFSRIMACFDGIMAMFWPYHVHDLPISRITKLSTSFRKCQHQVKHVNIMATMSTSWQKCQHHYENVNIVTKMSNSVSLNTRVYLINSVSLNTPVYLISVLSVARSSVWILNVLK